MTKSTPWLTGIGSKLTLNLGAIIKNGFATLAVLGLGAGGFAGAFFGLGSRPVAVDNVTLREETVRAIVNEAKTGFDRDVEAIAASVHQNGALIKVTSERLDRSEALLLENLRLSNRLLGRLEAGEGISGTSRGGS